MFCVHILYLWLYEHYQGNDFNKNHCSIYENLCFLFFYIILFFIFPYFLWKFQKIWENEFDISNHFACRNGINNWNIRNFKQIIYTWTSEQWSLNRFVLWWTWMVHIFKSNNWRFKKHNSCILKLSFEYWQK